MPMLYLKQHELTPLSDLTSTAYIRPTTMPYRPQLTFRTCKRTAHRYRYEKLHELDFKSP